MRNPGSLKYLGCLSAVCVLWAFAAVSGNRGAQSSKPVLLILNKSDNTMAIVDPATLLVVGRVATGVGPHEVTASSDGRTAFVGNYGTAQNPGSSLCVIDIAARKELHRIELPGLVRPHGIVESGGKVYFTAEGSRAVARYDPAANRIDWVMGTGQTGTHIVVVARDQKKIFTANMGSDTVTAIEPGETPAISKITQITVGQGPEGMDLSPNGRELWVAHRRDGGLSIIDAATDKVKDTIKVGKSPIRVKFTPDGQRVLVSDAMGNEVVVYEAATRKELKRIAGLDVPVGILIQPDGRRAYVASTRANKVTVIALDSLTAIAAIEPGREPDGMAWAGK